MITFVVGILFLLAALASLVVVRRMKRNVASAAADWEKELAAWQNERGYKGSAPKKPTSLELWPAVAIGVVVGIAGLSFVALSTISSVPAKNVGIVASYGKATGKTTGAGLKMHAPWEVIDDWDATRQAYEHRSEKTCVQVRIANLSNACVEAQVEWQTRPGNAPEQWGSYRKEFDRFVDKRVNPAIAESFNEAFASHDPLANIDNVDGKLNVPLAPFASAARTAIETKIGKDVEVLSVIVTRINYDEKTQANIEQFQQAVLKGRVLEKEKANADLQKRITETNAQVDAKTRCMELADKHSKEPGYCMWINGFPAASK